jgi:RNA 2',3'-cyclic 3'-phosphodiesterase
MISFYRYFLALRPPPLVLASLGYLRDPLRPGTWVLDRHLHMTMLLLAECSDRQPDLAKRVDLALAAWRFHACTIWLSHLDVRPEIALAKPRGRRPELNALRSKLEAAMLAAEMPAFWPEKFQPHVTLGRRLGFRTAQTITPIPWHADEIVLIESWVGVTHHETLGRWPLLPPLQRSFDFGSDSGLAPRPRFDRKRMDPVAEQVVERRVDGALTFDAAHSLELV